MNTITYRICKSKIERGSYNTQEEMQLMLDVFLAGDRFSVEEYQELTAILGARHLEPAQETIRK